MHTEYGDIIYDQKSNESFCDLIERVKYNASLAITDLIKETSQLKIYKQLGFESLRFSRWHKRLGVFYKIRTKQTSAYLYKLIPSGN